MTTVTTATEFTRNFAKYQRRVQREPIEIRSHAKVTGYFVSPEDYERVQAILAAARRPYHPSELPDHLKIAIHDARMGAEHDHLNALLDEE
jgi:PHD/YefM family antitoxin component YafN of YafNO toxin-antitoxin module